MNLLLISLIICLLWSHTTALNYTNCFLNCNTCQTTDFTKCVASGQKSCVLGYYFETSTQTCIRAPNFNQVTTELSSINNGTLPTDWTFNGTGDLPSSTCSTGLSQNITVLGQFSKQHKLTKRFTVSKISTVILNAYFIKLNWKPGDKVTASIQVSGTVLSSVDILDTSFIGDANTTQRYLETCGSYTGDAISAAQFSIEVTGVQNLTNLDVVFEANSTNSDNRWAVSNIRLISGCNNFGYGSLCKSCLSGFYFSNVSQKCENCGAECETCTGTASNCLSCPAYSAIVNGTCQYSNNFVIMRYSSLNDTNKNVTDVSTCNGVYMLGGAIDAAKLGSTLSRTFTLGKHIYLRLRFNFVRIGDWGGKTVNPTFTTYVDNLVYMTTPTFLSPLMSSFCNTSELSTVAPFQSDFRDHTASTATVKFQSTGQSPSGTTYYFALRDIVLILYKCPPQCQTCLLTSKMEEQCILCNQFLTQNSKCVVCPFGFYLDRSPDTISCKTCHPTCKGCDGPLSSNCNQCLDGFVVKEGYCQPDDTSTFNLFSIELDRNNFQWQNFECVPDCKDFTCGSYRLYGSQGTAPTSIKRKLTFPKHSGMLVMLDVFKLGDWQAISANYTDRNANMTITLLRDGVVLLTVPVNKTAGSNICSPKAKDFVYSLYKSQEGHTLENATFEIRASGPIAIRQFLVFLSNCESCLDQKLTYSVQYMPVYTRDNSAKGINTYIRFNRPLSTSQGITNAFNVQVNGVDIKPTETEYRYDLRMLLPMLTGFVNGNISTKAYDPDSILSSVSSSAVSRLLTTEDTSRSRLLAAIGNTLESRTQNTSIARYDILDDDNLQSIGQLHDLMFGFANAVLYTMLVFLGLGLGLVLQQFSLSLQLIFLHIYINSNELPASLKLSLQGMRIIEHLNYFIPRDRANIQSGILPKGLHQESPHIFEQYNVDINFIRAIYPIVIINLIYVGYFLILLLLNRFWPAFRQSENLVIRWFREIVERPINFIDYFLRWEFVTVIWSCVLQFEKLDCSTNAVFKGFNTFFTILFFVCAVLYPILLVAYLYSMKKILLKETFNYLYEDIFFRRIKKSQDEIDNFVYILIRFFRYFLYALFVGVFVNHQVVTPVILILATLLELLYIWAKEIYMDKVLYTLKVVEALFFVLLAILYLVSFATSNQWVQSRYLQLGFVADAFIIILIINCFLRAIYLAYLKISDFLERRYKVVSAQAANAVSRRELGRLQTTSVLPPPSPTTARPLASMTPE